MKKRARGRIVVGSAELERDFTCSTSTSWSGELAASCVPVRVRAACVFGVADQVKKFWAPGAHTN